MKHGTRWGVVAVVVVLAIGAIGAALLARDTPVERFGWEAAQPVRVVGNAPALAATPGWQDLGIPPRALHSSYAVSAWTGHELLLWGGQRLLEWGREPAIEPDVYKDHTPKEGLLDGVVLDPVAHTWRAIPPPPVDTPLLYPWGIWDGHELIVVGHACKSPTGNDACYPGGFPVVAYDPQRNRWERLRPPPDEYLGHDTAYVVALGWSGRLALFQTDGGIDAYDPAAHRWSKIAVPPHTSAVCASAHRIVALVSAPDWHFAVRADTGDGRWVSSAPFVARPRTWSSHPLNCTATGAAVVSNGRSAFVLDASRMVVTKVPPLGMHGDWLRTGNGFAPLAPDGNADVVLPDHTTAAFDTGRRVFAVVNEELPRGANGSQPLPGDGSFDRVETFLRH